MILFNFLSKNISQFLNGQIDYIYFFYGFSFFFFGVICLNSGFKQSQKLPWFLLGLFGIIHGINEWLQLFIIIVGTGVVTSFLHSTLRIVSYFFLFEFARMGYFQINKKLLVRPWIYLPIGFMIFVGAQSAINGLSIYIRYVLGFPAGILAAITVISAAKTDKKQQKYYWIIGAHFIIYAILTGLFVEKSDVFLAAHWNNDTFFTFFGFPLEFCRAVLILSLLTTTLFFFNTFSSVNYDVKKNYLNLKFSRLSVILSVIIVLGLGWGLTNFMDYYSNIKLIKKSMDIKGSPLQKLLKELSTLEKICISLSKSQVIRAAINSLDGREKVQEILEKLLTKEKLVNCYIVDKEGAVIASAGEPLPEKVHELRYISKLYFRDAELNQAGYHLSPVSADRERIYFVSYPIENAEGGIGAYVILSKIIKVKLLLEYRVFGILISLFICIAIIIIFVAMQKKETLIKYIQEVNTKLKAAGQVKTDFLSIVSHDLKTPLTAIKNAVTILIRDKTKNGFSSAQEKELIELILKNTERQASMVSNLLDVTKIESGVLALDIKYYDLWTLTQDTLQILSSQAMEKNISIDLKSSVKTLSVPVDIDHTERILGNLISNAVRYSPENSQVIVEIIEQENDVLISIADKGYGIADSELDKIFDKFYRSPDATLRQKGGSGLGLVITKGLVELQGGKIWVKSKLGEGTTFYFTLPKWRSR
ncbi:MAG: hypothetical protein KJ915_01325 [Candidatus Omnitrophica bacterium]|nr:hypothetical protein [Candidatus Omnitrophota bacterium]